MPAGHFAHFVRGLAVLAATGSMAFAEPPVDRGALSRGNTAVDRALESRARVTGRAGAAASLDVTPAATASERAAAHAHGTAGAGPGAPNGTAGTGPGAAATFGLETSLEKRGSASPQAGTGRGGRELRAAAGPGAARSGAADRAFTARAGAETRPGVRHGWSFRTEGRANNGIETTAGTARLNGNAAAAGQVRGRGRDPEFILSRADRLLAHRLAQIDRMRDQAIENDDEELLRQADKLEILARAQYTQRTTGEQTVGTAMRTFNADRPVGDDTTDPTDGTGTTDPGTNNPDTVDSTPVTPGGTTQTEIETSTDGDAAIDATIE